MDSHTMKCYAATEVSSFFFFLYIKLSLSPITRVWKKYLYFLGHAENTLKVPSRKQKASGCLQEGELGHRVPLTLLELGKYHRF